STNPLVATVSATGRIDALAQGTTILEVSSHGIHAATPISVGFPTDRTEQLLEVQGLDVYPDAVTLSSAGGTRQFRTGLAGEGALTLPPAGARYYVANPLVVTVSADGLTTAVAPGQTEVTIIYGAREVIVPVRVEAPQVGPAVLGTAGGVVQGPEGFQVAVPPGALGQAAEVSIRPLTQADLPLGMPEGFSSGRAFRLALGPRQPGQPAQLAIPVDASIPPGTEVFFHRYGQVVNEHGEFIPGWLQEDSGIVGTDGFARTASPPYPGVLISEGDV